MNKLYYLLPAIIPHDKCNEIVERGLRLPSQPASIGFNEDHVDNAYRISTIRWFPTQENKDIVELLTFYANIANRECFGFDISMGPNDIQFTEYHGSTKGKYDWHHDVWWDNPRSHDRKLSLVIQLSDPGAYVGGDFELGEPCDFNNVNFKPKGSLLIFPSFFRHRVLPVTQGTRYSLVTWIDGAKFR